MAKYRRPQTAAELSAIALKRSLEGLMRVLIDPARKASVQFKISFLSHSLGNYVVEKYIRMGPPLKS